MIKNAEEQKQTLYETLVEMRTTLFTQDYNLPVRVATA